ncbi:hypothetical protein [Sphingobium sp. C100]|nr:hypothetical protein [Sphingobium sp. C100]
MQVRTNVFERVSRISGQVHASRNPDRIDRRTFMAALCASLP